MSRAPDPTAGIVVSGATRVDTAELLVAVAVVAEAGLRVEAALAEGRRAHGLVSGLVDAPPSSVRWASGVAACYSTLGSGVPSSWAAASPEVVAARSALLEDVASYTDTLTSAAAMLQGLVDRLAKAAGVYEDGASGVESVFSWLAQVPAVGIGVLLGAGIVDVVRGVAAGQGLQPARLLTGSGAYHDEFVRGASVALGPLNPLSALSGRPAVEDAAGTLRGLSQAYRGLFDDKVSTTELSAPDLPAGFAKPVARSAEDLLTGVDVVYGKGNDLPDSVVSVEKYVDEDARATWVVTVPGTQLGNVRTPFSMTSNYDLVRGEDADSTAHVLQAMAMAGIPPGEEVVLVGHSQGGMVAMAVAAAVTGAKSGAPGAAPRYDVRQVLTAGAPVAGATLPAGVRGTHVEIEQEGVSQLDGADNPVGPRQVTVRADLEAPGAPGTGGKVPHGVPFHVDVLERSREVGHRGLAENLDALDRAVSGERVEARYFRGSLDLDVAAVARAATPAGSVARAGDGL
jgi:pimeloyl-ACP methyl ester carboxylesterase